MPKSITTDFRSPSRNADGKATATVEELNQRLSQHPEVKKALRQWHLKVERDAGKSRPQAAAKVDAKAPKLLRKAIEEDPRIADIAKATQHVMAYVREAGDLLEERAGGKRLSDREDKDFVKKWSGIETDYQTMVKGTCAVFRASPLLMASTRALAESPADLHVYSNPAFLDKDARAVADYLGLKTDEMDLYYEYSYLPNRKRVARGLASTNFGDALGAIAESVDQVAFELSPKRFVQGNKLTIGGDFLFLASFFAQMFAVVTTIVAVVAVVSAAAIAAIAAAALVQAVVPVLTQAGEWLSEQWHKAKDWLDDLDDDTIKVNGLPVPPCTPCDRPAEATIARSSLSVERIVRAGQNGDQVRIRVIVRDLSGCCVPGQDVVIEAGLVPLSIGDLVFAPLDLSRSTDGIYEALWGPGSFPGGKRTLKFRYFLNAELGQQGQIDVWPIGTNALTQLQDLRMDPDWVSTTAQRTPEETVQLFGYALGNMSRTKLEVHVPTCSFLYLVSPSRLRRFDRIEEGRSAGLDNCHYCIGDSTR